jgi:hypothetical protein
MDAKLNRRDLLGMGALTPPVQKMLRAQTTDSAAAGNKTTPYQKVVLEPFDYTGVTLRQSPWQRQASAGRDFLLGPFERRHSARISRGIGRSQRARPSAGRLVQPEFEHCIRAMAAIDGAHATRLRR